MSAMSDPRVSYTPREDATPEDEITALAAIYRLVLNCHDERKKGAGTNSGGEDGKGAAESNRTGAIVSKERP